MILGDNDIKLLLELNKLVIESDTGLSIQQNGVDCRIGDSIALDIELPDSIIDTHNKKSIDSRFVTFHFEEGVVVQPMSSVLLVTKEVFKIPDDLMAFCALRSSVARNGFIAPITIVDAGFYGSLTIELFYGGKNPIRIYKGDRFLHVIFGKINSPVRNVYSGTYNGQTGVRLPKELNK